MFNFIPGLIKQIMLSKSRYTRGLNCQKSLWLYAHKREEQEISESAQAIFSRGTSAGELAQQYFSNGKMAVLEDLPGYESAKRTQEFIQQGVETIYEGTFIFDNTLVAVDILHKSQGKWSLYEVKSTNSVKLEHIKDVAIQYYVAKGCGLNLENAFLMHFNRDYVRHGALEINKLYLPERTNIDLTARNPGQYSVITTNGGWSRTNNCNGKSMHISLFVRFYELLL